MEVKFVVYSLFSYLVGCICFGYYLTKFLSGKKLNTIGSQSVGATNVSRVLGWRGFVVTFVFDFLKGFLVAYSATRLGFPQEYVFLSSFLVVAGHIWPVQLRFKGGKGVSTYTGTMFALNFHAAFPVMALFVVFYPVFRKFSIAGIFSLALIPFFLIYLDYSLPCVVIGFMQNMMIFVAHRKNISDFFSSPQSEKQ